MIGCRPKQEATKRGCIESRDSNSVVFRKWKMVTETRAQASFCWDVRNPAEQTGDSKRK